MGKLLTASCALCLLVLSLITYQNCGGFKSLSENVDPKIISESQRLGLPVSSFASADKVWLGDDFMIDTNRLKRENDLLVIVSAQDSNDQINTQGNIDGNYWHGQVPIELTGVPVPTRLLIKRACEEFGVRCVCSNGKGDRIKPIIRSVERSYASNYGRDRPVEIILDSSDRLSYRVVAHELGHALGLVHEQSRSDRDQYVRVTSDFDASKIHGKRRGPFDFKSIMLYPCPTVEPLDQTKYSCDINGYLLEKISEEDKAHAQATKGPTDLTACLGDVAKLEVYVRGSIPDQRVSISVASHEFIGTSITPSNPYKEVLSKYAQVQLVVQPNANGQVPNVSVNPDCGTVEQNIFINVKLDRDKVCEIVANIPNTPDPKVGNNCGPFSHDQSWESQSEEKRVESCPHPQTGSRVAIYIIKDQYVCKDGQTIQTGKENVFSRVDSSMCSSSTSSENSSNVLSVNQSLKQGERLVSQDAKTFFTYQEDGNLVLYMEGKPTWASATNSKNGQLVMQSDGNLVLYDSSGTPTWSSGTSGQQNSFLKLENDSLVIINSAQVPIWRASSSVSAVMPKNETESTNSATLKSGSILVADQNMVSQNGRFKLTYQRDSNLVLTRGEQVIWNTKTIGSPGKFILQSDGNLVVYDEAGRALWASHTSGSAGSKLELQNDGNLVLYNSSGSPIWSSGTAQ